MITLTEIEVRIIGCLSEKEETTPDYYPLTLNSLTLACNQKSNRNPVVDYDEDEVASALDSLREKKLVMRVDVAGSRVAKFRHRIEEHFEITKEQKVLLTVLMLRGAQTLGELKGRTERMHKFSELLEVERALLDLNEELDEEMIKVLPPQPGQKERRYIHLLSEYNGEEAEVVQSTAKPIESSNQNSTNDLEARVTTLENEVSELKDQVRQLKEFIE